MPIPYDEKLATFTQLPLSRYSEPGSAGTYDSDFFIDWGSIVRGTKHVGDDIKATPGTPVYAIAHGILKYAAERGSPATKNWGWVCVLEHTFRNGKQICSIYGHAAPVEPYRLGDFVPIGAQLASIVDYEPTLSTWVNHLHFGVYYGAFGASPGAYPVWLKGYVDSAEFPDPSTSEKPGYYIDPWAFCEQRMPPQLSVDKTPNLGDARLVSSNNPLEREAIDYADDEDFFCFSGQAGQRISLAVTKESGTMTPQLAVYESRDGKIPERKIAGADIANAQPYFSINNWRVAITDMPLPKTGKYIIKIRSSGKTKGYYRFTKQVYK